MPNEELRIRNMERAMQTTCELVLKHGIENTTKEMLARESGMSRSSLDRYFADKTDCMVQSAEWAARRLAERMLPLAERLEAGTDTGEALLRQYLDQRRALYYERKELFIAIAELRVFIGRNCADSASVFERLTGALNFAHTLCRILRRGKADGTLLSSIDEREESVYINGFYRELLINLALTRNLPAEEEARMIDGFIDRMLRYYRTPDDRHGALPGDP